MKIEQEFEVPATPSDTYALLVDLERVAPCIPGGEVGPVEADGSHKATIAVKLGPMRMTYRGSVRIAESDDAAHRAVLAADVREQRGQGSAKATMRMAVAGGGAGSVVSTETDVKLTGRAAQMGRGVVDDVAARLVSDLSDCIAQRLGAGVAEPGERAAAEVPPAAPVSGLRLLGRVLWERLKRVFRREGEKR